ncbi:Major pollen allergen Ole e 6 [Capsicum annuum]|uniref:Major pollen allergen Ole e 6 n=1 Tax=Capsicum annuum TaxID=4072 RepID=A0A2G2Z6T6_CAPAN|nr:uncharacterized protein LOC107875189 [Capsicum annuum]PHT77720.1 Major pollen allergen Ole e 6 [Capsicum annuum]
MESSKRLVAMFLVCIVVISSSMHVSLASGEINSEKFQQAFKEAAIEYKNCYNTCDKKCSDEGLGYTHCEIKCDEDCASKLLKERFQTLKN